MYKYGMTIIVCHILYIRVDRYQDCNTGRYIHPLANYLHYMYMLSKSGSQYTQRVPLWGGEGGLRWNRLDSILVQMLCQHYM